MTMLPDRPDGHRRQWWTLAGFLLATLVVAGVGGLITVDRVPTWYAQLNKPEWVPPSEFFSPVWTVLYIAMAVAAWLVWLNRDVADVRAPLLWWAFQLGLNLGWTVFFFGLRSPGLGSLEIGLLWAAITVTIVGFFRVSRLAGWLMVPYLGWVTFAAALTISIWNLNR